MFLSPYVTTVSVPAVSKDMTRKETVKAELGITATTYDDLIDVLIQQASAACATYCGRVFASETVISIFRQDYWTCRGVEGLKLDRTPVTSIISLVEDGTTLTVDDYEVGAEDGKLWKLNASDQQIWFPGQKIVVTYVGGYAMLTDTSPPPPPPDVLPTPLPPDLERACIDMVKIRWFARARDPMVKSLDVVDVGSEQLWVGDAPGSSSGIPAAVTALLDPYRPRFV